MLDGKELGRTIWNEIKKGKDATKTIEFWEIFGEALCKYLKNNAEVLPGIELLADGKLGASTGKGKIN